MLSTLLEIGKKFRESPAGLKHHRYVEPAPQREPENAKAVGNSTRFFRVPVEADGSFDFAQREEFDDENLIEKLFYLNYKTSDAESYKKYIFGDIFKLRVQKGKDIVEEGNFRFGDAAKNNLYGKNSFLRAEVDADSLENERIQNFRCHFARQMAEIEAFFHDNPNVFLHFDFVGQHWHHLKDVMETINTKLMSSFTRTIENNQKELRGHVLRKALYKTLSPADKVASARVPHFLPENSYKNKFFDSLNDVMDLLYVVKFSSKPVLKEGEVKVIVLPRGEGLSAEQIERFFTRQALESRKPEEKAQRIRDDVSASQEDAETQEHIFAAVLNGASKNMAQFDFVFSLDTGGTRQDIDMVEVVGLERGLLECLSDRVGRIRREVEEKRPKSEQIAPLSITRSFLNILGQSVKAQKKFFVRSNGYDIWLTNPAKAKKYQSHLFKVLPQIYTGTYYRDDVLLPALIEKTEFNIRNEQANFGLLKFDFYFLTKLLNRQEERMKEITSSPSYHIGTLLGRLARQFSGPKSPIKSFEKNYVGLLSRRITSLPEVVRLGNEINQKLVMHEIARFTFRDSHAFAEAVKNFSGVYNKDECAFGFFESYFAPLPAKKEAAGEDEAAPELDTNAE